MLPNGSICRISDAYPGSTTDKELFLASKVLEILEPGDMVLSDKGFLIADCLPDGKSNNDNGFSDRRVHK